MAKSLKTRIALALMECPALQIADREGDQVFTVEEVEPGLFQSVFPARLSVNSALFSTCEGAWGHILEVMEGAA